MTLNQIKIAFYALFLTNKFGLKLRKVDDPVEVTELRLKYAETLLSRLNISVEVEGAERLVKDTQYLVVSNHRSIADPLIVEVALKNSGIHGLWVAKKELYKSFFFGMFTRNAGTILLDRDSKQMSSFFKEIKANVAQGYSISVFPEGTRNKTDKPLAEFKEGSQMIAMKNRLPILPLFIKSNVNAVLMDAIKNNTKDLKVTVEIGDVIDYKDRSQTLEESYKQRFNIA
ncbi:MAG: 1-acyl-sn-glycerol-3-phosphate acyltransferase [Gammaproteobacteria bacterium]|nr:1-acyl-sn-glycerol-3-phosphate acyltransferase [Gammaproteobacteria bacterium]MCK5262531.1 1-acyl-sn-glycerol-3-phosphate acyltransferase [Gammaproteobacteria bacterium]